LGDLKAEAADVAPALLWNTKIANQYVSSIAKWLHEVSRNNPNEDTELIIFL